MKNKLPFCAIVLFVSLYAGCDLPPLIVLFNNSGKSLTVYADKKTYAVKHNSFGEIDYPGNEQILRFDDGSTIFQYKIQYPPKDYMYGKVFRAYVINLQIESDRRIYVLKPDLPAPSKVLPQQPLGFPLTNTTADEAVKN